MLGFRFSYSSTSLISISSESWNFLLHSSLVSFLFFIPLINNSAMHLDIRNHHELHRSGNIECLCQTDLLDHFRYPALFLNNSRDIYGHSE